MPDPKTLCGPHSEIVKTDGVRITRCSCGTLHVHLARNGTTVQFVPEYFAEVAQAFGLAQTVLSGHDPTHQTASIAGSGQFITISPFDPKKPSN